MIQVNIERHVLDGIDRESDEVEALLPWLVEHFEVWPDGARLYHGPVSQQTDVTPTCAEDVEALTTMPGPFTVLILPMAAFAPQLILFAVSLVATALLTPDIPNVAERTVRNESPNNGLQERSNQVRINGRIPDIFGQVRSVPDVLQSAYKVFENHVEKEIGYLLVGKGAYEIAAADVRDDTTPVQEIAGTSVEIYGPYTSPNSGHNPQLRIGNPINTLLLVTQRLQSVNGQELLAPNSGGSYRNDTQFLAPNIIKALNPAIDYTTMFVPGDQIEVSEAAQSQGTYNYTAAEAAMTVESTSSFSLPGDLTANWQAGQILSLRNAGWSWLESAGGESEQRVFQLLDGVFELGTVTFDGTRTLFTLVNPQSGNPNWGIVRTGLATYSYGAADLTRASGVIEFDLSGTYVINTVTSDTITLNAPSSVNPDWNLIGTGSRTLQPILATTGQRWVGEFTITSIEPMIRIITNFVAPGGLYSVGQGQQQFSESVQVEMEVTPVDEEGEPIGPPDLFTGTVVGSAVSRSTRALTIEAVLAQPSRNVKVRARRLTPVIDNGRSVSDEIKWRDVYGASLVFEDDFGDVTTVQTVTLATDGALAVKERKLNMLVTRKLPQRTSSGFTTELYPTKNIADILSFICLDPHIGNRQPDEIDFDNFYNTAADIVDYFGFPEAAEFSYTLDDNNLSAEETIELAAKAVFCNAYRRGNIIRLFFERENPDNALLFNHRNKLPGSEARSVQFGPITEFDGVEYQYVSPVDDSIVTLYRPENRSAVNPKVVNSVGVRNAKQANIAAWREFNRLLYQNTTTEFDALPVADLLTLNERILVADNTRSGAMDGDVLEAFGLELYLSQPMPWLVGETYTMFLQNADMTVEAIPVTQGQTRRHAILARAPLVPVVTSGEAAMRTTFIVVQDGDERNATPFLVSEKDPSEDGGHVTMTAINYDPLYYEHDGDFRP